MLPKALRSLLPGTSRSLVLKTFSFALVWGLALAGSLYAQSASSAVSGYRAPADRLTQPVVEANRVVLAGTVHPLANKANDRGAAADNMKLDRLQVVLKRSDAQELALKQLIGEMHSPGSASYHKWLTPEDFGKQFGPSDSDIAKLESWLGSHGFSITKLNPGRQTLEIAGTAGQFRDTFHTAIHSYQVKGGTGGMETHFANAGAPEIPAALAPVLGGFASLNNFRLKNYAHVLGKAQFNPATHEAKPDWTYGTTNGLSLVVTPADFAVQYDVNPVYTAGTKGDGQSIAIVNVANINIALVNNYRALFGLPVNPPQVIIDGSDPGIDGNNSPFGRNGASIEAYLDVEVSGAVAPNAQVNLVIADSTALQDGLSLAAERAVYSNISPVISLSFGNCEAFLQSGNAFWNNLWEQAAAQGITVMVSSGDSGSAACDDDNSQQFAVDGQQVNGFASTPYNVAVGGTDFYYSGGSASFANYWNNLSSPTTNTPSESIKTKIPEQPFNSSQFGLNIYPQSNSNGTTIFAAGGGASTLGLLGSNGSYGPYPKPSWQSGTGVPADNARDIPDVSLFGSLSTNDSYTPICSSDGDCETPATVVQISGVGGTSVSAPEFAGIMALVNQKYGRQGQANYVLYPLAAASRAGTIPSVFNDVTVGTNTVPCNLQTVFDSDNNGAAIAPNDCQTASPAYTITDNEFGQTVEGEIGVTANAASYNAGVGYDLASGLGSVDVNNLITNWGSVRTGTSTTTLTASPTTFAHGTAVTISGTVSGTSPTGNVALITTSADQNTKGETTIFPVANGAYSGTVTTLPGGTYTLSGYYGGDGSNGVSTSAPVQVTVTPEASTTALTIYTTALANTPGTLASGGTISYGAVAALSAKATGATSGSTSKPTGSVAFSDGGTALNTAVLNVEGDAEFTKAFAIGTHSITATYSGDQSFTGSFTAAATTFNVTANTPVFYFDFTNQDSNNEAVTGQTTYVAVEVENSSNYPNAQALPPAGTVTVSGAPAGVPTTATLVPSVDPIGNVPEGTAYFAFPSTKTGTSTLTFTFTPSDANYTAATSPQQSINFVRSAGSIATTISASANSTTTSPTSPVTVTATVTSASGSGAPTGTVVLYASEEIVGLAGLPASSSSSATVTIGLSSSGLFGGTNQITAQYYPNTNTYIGSATSLTVVNPLNDFSLVPVAAIVNVPGPGAVSAGVQTDVINLNSYSGFSGAVSLACTGSGGVTCSLSSSSVTLASGGTGSTTLSVNTSAVTAAGTYNVVVTGTDSTGHLIHTIGLQVVTPLIVSSTAPGFSLFASPTAVSISAAGGSGTTTIIAGPVNGFTGTVALTCAISGPAGATDVPTCSAASIVIGTAGPTAPFTMLTFNTLSTTTVGAYIATVTGTSGTTTAATTVGVTVAGPVVTPGTFSLSNNAAITVATQGGTGSSMISVVPGATNPYAGSVALTCAVTASPTGASEIPTCSLNPASVTLAGATLTSTLTISTTAQTTSRLNLPLRGLFTAGGSVALATLLFLGVPVGRRGRRALRAVRTLRMLSIALLFAMIAGAGIGCGGGSSNSSGGGGTTTTGGTTTGAYSVTVTATPASGTAQTVAVSLTVN